MRKTYHKHDVTVDVEGYPTNLNEILSQTAKNVQLQQPIMLTAVFVTPRTIVEL